MIVWHVVLNQKQHIHPADAVWRRLSMKACPQRLLRHHMFSCSFDTAREPRLEARHGKGCEFAERLDGLGILPVPRSEARQRLYLHASETGIGNSLH